MRRNIYIPTSPDGFELCHPIDVRDFARTTELFSGAAIGDAWVSIRFQLIRSDEGRDLAVSDSPWLGEHALILRPRAVSALLPLLTSAGELLHVDCNGDDLRLWNVTKLVEGLDVANSVLERYEEGGIMYVDRYRFLEPAIAGLEVFKLRGLQSSPTFVGDEFVRLWRRARLRGLDFLPVG